jgi:hypothetical protein
MTSDHYDQAVSMLRNSLEQNVGNRLTPELATGIMNVFSANAAALIDKHGPTWSADKEQEPRHD